MISPLGRIVEIADSGRHLAKERGFLVVSSGHEELGRVPLDDLAAVLVTARGTSVSVALLSALAQRGVSFVVPGENFAPAALLWPVEGHHAQQRRMEMQIERTRPMAKRLWAQLVAAKIRRQGWALGQMGRPSGAFARLAREVRSGDPTNLEAQAARRYWPLMMGRDFRRDTNASGANALLNYGYAVLRAATARAIAASGLHPGLGVHHRHPHNPMPLADDLMEPFRPLVDLEVCTLLSEGITDVDPSAKRRLAGLLWRDEASALGISPLSSCLLRTAQSLAESYLSGEPALEFPLLRLEADGEGKRTAAKRVSGHVADGDVRSAGADESAA
jgi:CRISPR-associated protein Cas1